MRLGIVTKNDVIGLCEIADNASYRLNTVTCISEKGSAYFMSKAHLLLCYNKMKFTGQIVEERKLEARSYLNRIVDTFDF